MKTSVLLLVLICGGVAAGLVYLNHHKAAPAAVTETATPVAAAEPAATPEPPAAASPESPAPAPAVAVSPAPSPALTAPKESSNPITKAVDALLTAKSGPEKHEMFQRLIKSGQLDQAIAELQQRVTDNTNDAKLPTTLGEAQLNKVRALHESGNPDVNDMGILAMQADKNFNAALKIDPTNWEAQFVKAASQFYWPPEPTRDAAVAQQLSNLIDQQEGQPPRPEFAQPYVVLGNQYQKMGQSDKALATWQLGLQKFPADSTLQKKVADAARQ